MVAISVIAPKKLNVEKGMEMSFFNHALQVIHQQAPINRGTDYHVA